MDMAWIKGEVVEVWQLVQCAKKLRMLVCDMLLNKGDGLEQLLASLAPELALVLSLDVRVCDFAQFVVVRFAAVFARVNFLSLN